MRFSVRGDSPSPTFVIVLGLVLSAGLSGCSTTSGAGAPDETGQLGEATADEGTQDDGTPEPGSQHRTQRAREEEHHQELECYLADEYTVDIAVAGVDIPAGDPLRQEQVTTQEVPRQFLPRNPLFAEDIEIYLGHPIDEEISAGDMILMSDFSIDRHTSTLSGRVPHGHRAMTIPADAVSALGGLLEPGDRIDILGTFPVSQGEELRPDTQGSEQQGYLTVSLLQNVTLLAVGSHMSGMDNEEQQGGDYNSVTLSLTPLEAELMVIAQTRGELTLLLRNREDLDQVPVERRNLREMLENLDLLHEQRRERLEEQPSPCPPGQMRNDQGWCL